MDKYAYFEELLGYEFKSKGLLHQILQLDIAYDDYSYNREYLIELGNSLINTELLSYLINQYSIASDNGLELMINIEHIREYVSRINSDRYIDLRIHEQAFYYDDIIFSEDEDYRAVANVFRALIAGIYIDSGYNNNVLRLAIKYLINPEEYLNEYDGINYLDKIKRWCNRAYLAEPEFNIYENDENRTISDMYIDNPGIKGVNTEKLMYRGYGDTDSEASLDAARQAFINLYYLFELHNPILDNDLKQMRVILANIDKKRALKELVDRKLLTRPIITYSKKEVGYAAYIRVLEYHNIIKGLGATKKDALINAIEELFNKIAYDINHPDKAGISKDIDEDLPF